MSDLELKRAPGDRRLYALEGVGTLRLEGLASRAATAEAGEERWRIARRRLPQRGIQATDATGTAVGEFKPSGLRRGGALRWSGRELTLRPASQWRERYALADGDHELAILDGTGAAGRPGSPSTTSPASSRGCCCSRPSSCAGWRRTPAPPRLRRRPAADGNRSRRACPGT